ncbi:sec1 family domain-containing protein 2-like [Oscarella lobularis]|uniref:sec1 family domain-containing protein 2-like n=1 Tax=Oscarella lobularis TaxID=121494 RepID=UPI0033140EFD
MRWRSDSTWEPVVAASRRSAVYLDDEAAELCRLNGAHERLVATEAKLFPLNGKGDASGLLSTCVLVCARFVAVKHLESACLTLSSSTHSRCLLFTTTSEELLAASEIPCENYDEVGAELEQALRRTRRDKETRVRAEVHQFTACAAPINSDLFLMPAFHDLPLLWPGDESRFGDVSSMSVLPEKWQTDLRIFVSMLNSLFGDLDVNEDCYSVGHTSRLIAMELANLPAAKARRKTTSNKASLVLIDRTLDMVGCASHLSDCLADRIVGLLPKFHSHSSDVAINMSPMFSANVSYSTDALAPGTLYHGNSQIAQSLLRSFISLREKEAVMEVSRLLLDAMAKERIPVEVERVTRMTVDRLKGFVRKFSSEPEAFLKHSALLECSLAAINTLECQETSHWERLLATEKGLLLGVLEESGGSDSPLSQLCSLVQSDKQMRHLTAKDVLVLCIFLYSLLPEEKRGTLSDEEKLKKALVLSIQTWHSDEQKRFVGSCSSLREKIEEVFSTCRAFGNARAHLKQLKNLFIPRGPDRRNVYVPLVKQVVEASVDPSKPDVSDIAYQSHGLRDYLKTSLTFGFSKFMNVGKSHPGNHRLLFVFVVGGVTLGELKQIRETASKTNIEVVVGSNRILSPRDVYEDLVIGERHVLA